MLTLALILLLSLVSARVMATVLHDPYHDLHVLPVPDWECPDLTFDSRGFA